MIFRLRPALCFFAAILIGCGGSAIRPVTRAGEADPAPWALALDRYNGLPRPAKAVGKARLPDGGRIDFAARYLPGEGFRFDALAGPFLKLFFSAACEEGAECAVYLPDREWVVRQPEDHAAAWLGMLLSGRIPRLGVPLGAWRDEEGDPVLRLEDRAAWQLVVFDGQTALPRRVLYGDKGKPAELEIQYLRFRKEGETWYPVTMKLCGERKDQWLLVDFTRLDDSDVSKTADFKVKVPEGTSEKRGEGISTWKSMGFIWMPNP